MKRIVTWNEIESFVQRIRQIGQFNGVYGIPRGGVVLAVMVSHYYDVPMLSAPCEGCLIIDDICDSGESLLHYKNNTSGNKRNKYKIATVAYKEGALVKPDFFMIEKKNDWFVFPWEMGRTD